jgi:hypothetical protein
METAVSVSVELADITVKVDALWAKRVTQIKANNQELQPLVYEAWKLLNVSAGRPVKGADTFRGWLAERGIPERTGERILHRERVRLGEKVPSANPVIPPSGGIIPDSQSDEELDDELSPDVDDEADAEDIPTIDPGLRIRPRGIGEHIDALLDDPGITLSLTSAKLPPRTVTESGPAPVKEVKKSDIKKKREVLELRARQTFADADAWLDKVVIDAIEARLVKEKKTATREQIAGAASMIASLKRAEAA